MAVRTKRLGEAIVVTTSTSLTATIFTVPTDRVAIVKEIVVSQVAGSTPTTFYFYVDTAGADTLQVAAVTVTANDTPTVLPRWLVLQEGDQLVMAQSSSRTSNVYVSGSLLAGDPA